MRGVTRLVARGGAMRGVTRLVARRGAMHGFTKLVVIAIVCACSGEGARTSAKPEERAHTGKVVRRDVVDRVLLAGTLHATRSEELRTPRTPMWELPIRWMPEDGAVIKAGERALEFDNSSFVSTLAEKKLQYIDAAMAFDTFLDVSSLDQAQKTFELENARLVHAKAKVQASVPADLLPARTAQERQLELKRAEAAVARAEKELASAQAASKLEKQVKQIELDKAKNTILDAEKAIGELLIKAPREGIIVVGDHPWMGRKFQIGDSVQPGWTIVALPDLSSGMEVRAELSDVDDGRVSNGMQGTCTLDAYPAEAMPCTVKSMMPVASGKGGQSLRRGFALVMALAKVDDKMRPGMSVKVELRRPPLANAIVVPRGALQLAKDKARVRLASGELRDVELGACDAQGCVVTKGLTEGEGVAW
jgi:multidrug efflux pump subunit AcrA (membrane-fusion protein)